MKIFSQRRQKTVKTEHKYLDYYDNEGIFTENYDLNTCHFTFNFLFGDLREESYAGLQSGYQGFYINYQSPSEARGLRYLKNTFVTRMIIWAQKCEM